MLSTSEVKTYLKHCETVNKTYEGMNMAGDEGPPYFEFMRNKGWMEALRLVLETNTKSINNKSLQEKR